LHVLSLPPAFVLSQNQTLRLRFDSDTLGIIKVQREIVLLWRTRTNQNRFTKKRYSVSVSLVV
jgi:hypothetical protein